MKVVQNPQMIAGMKIQFFSLGGWKEKEELTDCASRRKERSLELLELTHIFD